MPQPGFERHFCVTVYVQEKETNRYLLIRHKKLQKWLAPGGHVDENELCDHAAVRECLEETGLDVELIGERPPVSGGLVRPAGIQLNVIKPELHEHMDLVYLGRPTSPAGQIVLNADETEGIRWFHLDEILADDFDTFPDVKYWVKRFSADP